MNTFARRMLAFPEIGLALIIAAHFTTTAALSRTAREPVMDAQSGRPLLDSSGERVTVERNLFLKPDNLRQIARETSYFAIMAVGATLVLACGGVDLSIGSIFCLSAVAAAFCMSPGAYTGGQMPISPAQELEWIAAGRVPSAATRILIGIPAGLATGMLCGLINGLLVTTLKSPPFLITLGTMLIFRCIAFLVTSGNTIFGLPQAYVGDFGQKLLPGGLNIHVPLMLLVVAAGWIFLSYSVPGRMALAVGGNEEAARTAGLPVRRIKILVYTLAGALGGLAGLLYISFSGAIQSGDGHGFELTVIAATVIGGASLSGGRGTAIGALLGALFLEQIKNALYTLQINQNFEQLVIGLVIVAAAGFNRLREKALSD